ncbi:MAG: glycosyl hydrolase family 28-related protein, partial [Janthinobacterium lividum]
MQLLPNGKQQFFNNAGVPLAGGKVYFYQPGTTTPLITWQDQAGTTANANPVTLDGAGEAVIWGNTTYRQVVQDSTGTQIWDELVDAAVSHDELASPSGSALIGFVQAGPGAVPRTVQDKVRESIGIMDFGAVGDGVTDDGPAIQAAIVYAASFASGVKIRPIVLIPAGTYRIATTIIAASYVKIVGYGAELIGPIAGYPPIGNTTAVAAAGDIQAQTGGACFADTILTDPSAGAATVVSAAFEGFTLNNFRYGFCSRGFSWYYPELRNITWVNINIGCFAYNGAQMWKLENPAANNCNVVFVGAATAYTSGHPLSSNIFTGSFCDGLQVVGYSSNPMLTNANPDLDNWFSQSVLRPNSISTVEGFSGVYPLATASPANLATTFQNVSGRAIYIGQRHNRLTFNTSIRNIHSLGAARGVVCIANPTNLQLSHFGGEGMFTNSTINAGPTECVVVLGNTNGATISASVSNVEGAYVTGTVYDSVVGVAGSAAIYSDIELHNITGKTNPIYYQFFISANLAVDTYGAYSVNNFRTDINLNAIIPQTASQYVTVLGGSWQREFDNSTGLSLIKK